MKETLKKSLKLEKRSIRKLDVKSGLHGGQYGVGPPTMVCNTDTCDCINPSNHGGGTDRCFFGP